MTSHPFFETEFGELGSEAAEKEPLTGAEGSLKWKSGLPLFKLPSLMPKEKGIDGAYLVLCTWNRTQPDCLHAMSVSENPQSEECQSMNKMFTL